MNEGFEFYYLDLILIFVLIAFVYKGYKKRFFKEFVGLIGMVIAMVTGLAATSFLAPNLFNSTKLTFGASLALAFTLAFLFVRFLYRLFEKWLYKHAKFEMTDKLDQSLGLVIGAIKGILVAGVLAVFLQMIPMGSNLDMQMQNSTLLTTAEKTGTALFDKIRTFVPGSSNFVVYLENAALKANPQRIEERTLQVLKDLNSEKVDQWTNSNAKK